MQWRIQIVEPLAILPSNLDDIFALQDRITEAVAGAIAPTIQRAEIERARRIPPRSFSAYDLWLRALPPYYEDTRESNARAAGSAT